MLSERVFGPGALVGAPVNDNAANDAALGGLCEYLG